MPGKEAGCGFVESFAYMVKGIPNFPVPQVRES